MIDKNQEIFSIGKQKNWMTIFLRSKNKDTWPTCPNVGTLWVKWNSMKKLLTSIDGDYFQEQVMMCEYGRLNNLYQFLLVNWHRSDKNEIHLSHLESIPIRILRHFFWLSVHVTFGKKLCIGKTNVVFFGTCQNKVLPICMYFAKKKFLPKQSLFVK